ncbi:hypothetical protein J6590_013575 [Homalodisca vitripennis]|nr:hypothetical protein J6590_013575 [Homalodisca vitripennis]
MCRRYIREINKGFQEENNIKFEETNHSLRTFVDIDSPPPHRLLTITTTRNRCVTLIWVTANVEILGRKGNSIGLVYCGRLLDLDIRVDITCYLFFLERLVQSWLLPPRGHDLRIVAVPNPNLTIQNILSLWKQFKVYHTLPKIINPAFLGINDRVKVSHNAELKPLSVQSVNGGTDGGVRGEEGGVIERVEFDQVTLILQFRIFFQTVCPAVDTLYRAHSDCNKWPFIQRPCPQQTPSYDHSNLRCTSSTR